MPGLDQLHQDYAIEMLDIPPNSVVYKIDQLGLNATQVMGNGPLPALTAFATVNAGLSVTQTQIATNIVNDYINVIDLCPGVRFNNSQISQNVNGVTIDFNQAIEGYKKRLRHYIPFWNAYETRQTRETQTQTMRSFVSL